MNIYGIQKLTALDYPGRIATTIFIGGCNLRCPFCHNAGIVLMDKSQSEVMTDTEIKDLILARKFLVPNVVISGGEPLANLEIYNFIRDIKQEGFSIKLDTNGCFPLTLERILGDNLVDYVAMDIKNSIPKYAKTTGIENLNIQSIKKSVEILRQANIPYEFRTTLVKEFHELSDIIQIGLWLNGAPNYYLQKFANSGNLIHPNLHAVPNTEMEKFQIAASQFFGNVQLRGI